MREIFWTKAKTLGFLQKIVRVEQLRSPGGAPLWAAGGGAGEHMQGHQRCVITSNLLGYRLGHSFFDGKYALASLPRILISAYSRYVNVFKSKEASIAYQRLLLT